MTTNLSFIDRIKVLCRELIEGKPAALNRGRSYEVRILPSSGQQSTLSRLHPVKIRVSAPRLSGRSDRLCWGGSRQDVEHTRSNLG